MTEHLLPELDQKLRKIQVGIEEIKNLFERSPQDSPIGRVRYRLIRFKIKSMMRLTEECKNLLNRFKRRADQFMREISGETEQTRKLNAEYEVVSASINGLSATLNELYNLNEGWLNSREFLESGTIPREIQLNMGLRFPQGVTFAGNALSYVKLLENIFLRDKELRLRLIERLKEVVDSEDDII